MGNFARKQNCPRYRGGGGRAVRGRIGGLRNRQGNSNLGVHCTIETHATEGRARAENGTLPRIVRPDPFSNTIRRKMTDYGNSEEDVFQEKRLNTPGPLSAPRPLQGGLRRLRQSPGKPLPRSVLDFMGARFGHDFSPVRLHTDPFAARLSRDMGARAFTVKNHIAFGGGQYRPGTMDGMRLVAHELTHVVQQGGVSPGKTGGREKVRAGRHTAVSEHGRVPFLQREEEKSKPEKKDVTGPLTEKEWDLVDIWRSRGRVGIEKLTDDPDYNSRLVAAEILCGRLNLPFDMDVAGEDPLLCLIPAVTAADSRVKVLQKQVTARGSIQNKPSLTGPLIDSEWDRVDLWLAKGVVGGEALTGDPGHNAVLVAEAIFCSRYLESGGFMKVKANPSLCVLPQVTRADPRVQKLMGHVIARGPIIHWPEVQTKDRVLYVMERLVDHYGYSVNGAAGIVGNLWAESGLIPSRIQQSAEKTPMRAPGFDGKIKDFTPEEVMNRSAKEKKGPRASGIGIVQWTPKDRRSGLFEHEYRGEVQGASILFNMDAQIDYMVSELKTIPHVDRALKNAGISLSSASDKLLLEYERPKAVQEASTRATVVAERRNHAHSALMFYRVAHPEQ